MTERVSPQDDTIRYVIIDSPGAPPVQRSTTTSPLPPPVTSPVPQIPDIPALKNPLAVSVKGKGRQTKAYQPRDAGICSGDQCNPSTPVASCGPDEWRSGTRPCNGNLCPRQPICSKPDPSACPVFSEAATSVTFTTPPEVECSYTLPQFGEIYNVRKWESLYGKDQTYRETIMPYFCSLPSDKCPVSSLGSPGVICSRFKSTDQAGLLCREWQKESPLLADASMMTYCQKTPGLDCGCINRESNEVFRYFDQYAPSNPACWFKPCQNSFYNLVPSVLKNPQCPPGFCQQIEKGYQETQKFFIPFDQVQDNLVCPLTKPPQPRSTTPWIVLFWVFLLIFIVIILVLALRRAT